MNLIDTTLREGEQTTGITFTSQQKKAIIDGLVLIGIAEIEVGIASPLVRDLGEVMAFCRCHHPCLQTSLWCRCRQEDILHAGTFYPDCLSLSIPVSDLHLHRKFNKGRSWAESTMISAVRLALKQGMRVSIGFEDATRADLGFLSRMAQLAEQEGVFRIRLADTVGIASPVQIISLVKEIQRVTPSCDIAIHAHNDFGMATANAIAALESGASWADVTVLGLGERSGCARLEELAGYLGMMRSDSRIQTQHLKPLAGYVAGITNRSIEDCRPILGEKIFTCETGLHLQGLHLDPATYEPYPPERVGAKRQLLTGAKCGRNAIKKRISALGFNIDDDLLLQKTRDLRNRAIVIGKSLDDAEFLMTMQP
jgi:homocitrate synthase NifV